MEYYKEQWEGAELTWVKFFKELRDKFYLITIQRQKKKDFTELGMTKNMIIMHHAGKFVKLTRFIPNFIASKRMKIRRVEGGLAFHIKN